MGLEGIAERARLEGDEAEADDETPEPGEPEPEPTEPTPAEPTPEDAEKLMQRATAALDKEDERHAKRYRDVMGEAADDLLPCPLCWRPGFIFPPDAMQPANETQAALLTVLRTGGAAQFKTAEDTRPCDACDGFGVVITGSKAPGHETKNCSSCGGIGWLSKPVAAPPPYEAPPVAWTPPVVPGGSPQTLGGDRWNRPPGHPDWGRDPAMIVSAG